MLKKSLFCLFLVAFVLPDLNAQDQENVKCTVELSKKEILAGSKVQVVFTLENVQNARFIPPQWPDNADIVFGPSQSSQVQVINGVVSSKQSCTYLLKVKDEGTVVVPSAKFAVGDKTWETEPQTILVKPNPDGVVEEDEKPSQRRYDFWGNPIPDRPVTQPKSKRPTVRL